MFNSRPKLVDTRSGQEHRILKDEVVIGRHRSCDIVIPVVEVSRRHCRIFLEEEDGRYYVEDIRTMNGTYVNEETTYGSTPLQHGFHLKVAKCTKFPGGVRNYVFRHEEQAERMKAERDKVEMAKAEAAAMLAEIAKSEKTPLYHCAFKIVRRKERPRQVPVLKFGREEVRFLNLFPLPKDEVVTLLVEHPSWAESMELPLKVTDIARIKSRPVFQIQAAVSWTGGHSEQAERLIGETKLLKYFS